MTYYIPAGSRIVLNTTHTGTSTNSYQYTNTIRDFIVDDTNPAHPTVQLYGAIFQVTYTPPVPHPIHGLIFSWATALENVHER